MIWVCLKSVLSLFGVCFVLEFVQSLSGVIFEFVYSLFGVCVKFRFEVCQEFVWSLNIQTNFNTSVFMRSKSKLVCRTNVVKTYHCAVFCGGGGGSGGRKFDWCCYDKGNFSSLFNPNCPWSCLGYFIKHVDEKSGKKCIGQESLPLSCKLYIAYIF